MLTKSKRLTPDNIIRVSSKKPVSSYFEAILIRVQPAIYDKYNCVKIRFTKDLETDVNYLCQLFWHLGLVPKKKERLKEGLQLDKGVIIGEAYEISLEKIGAIQFEDNSDYLDWIKRVNEDYRRTEKSSMEEEKDGSS